MPDVVAQLGKAFERIASTRMVGLPFVNPALQVATIGFTPWEEARVGVLVTPWSINLVAVANHPETLRLATDTRRRWRFPSGEYDLMGGEEPECGCFQFCSLFSPALDFANQEAAITTATAAMEALFTGAERDEREAARMAGSSVLQAPTSRRGFLRGVFGAANS